MGNRSAGLDLLRAINDVLGKQIFPERKIVLSCTHVEHAAFAGCRNRELRYYVTVHYYSWWLGFSAEVPNNPFDAEFSLQDNNVRKRKARPTVMFVPTNVSGNNNCAVPANVFRDAEKRWRDRTRNPDESDSQSKQLHC